MISAGVDFPTMITLLMAVAGFVVLSMTAETWFLPGRARSDASGTWFLLEFWAARVKGPSPVARAGLRWSPGAPRSSAGPAVGGPVDHDPAESA
jgi:hypothetical protein